MAKMIWPYRQSQSWVVGGLDVRGDAAHLVVLTGTALAADGVSCAERLALPEDCMVEGQLVQPQVLARWFKDWLRGRDLHLSRLVVAITEADVVRGTLRLPFGLQPDDVAFQIAAEVQAAPNDPPVSWDFTELNDLEQSALDMNVPKVGAPTDERTYAWATAPRARVDAWQQFALAAGIPLSAVMPRDDVQVNTHNQALMAQMPPAQAGLARQYVEALGLALGAWHGAGFNFLPYRAMKQRALRLNWLQRVAAGTLSGALLALGAAFWMTQMANNLSEETGDIVAAEQSLKAVRSAQKQAQTALTELQALAQWLHSQAGVQQQTLQWSRVLGQHSQGLWVSEVKQQQAHWLVKGEALSAAQAQHLAQQLKGLDIWAQAPELRHLELAPPQSATGLSVWHFRIEADLKAGV
jgi:Tfp pilus assembly protein PilN